MIRYGDFKEWYETISHGGYSITPNTRIIVGTPFNISHEWRCFMVGGKVSSASQYRKDKVLSISAGAPPEVIEFAESMANLWSPSDVFVMDVARCGQELYTLENNCFNSSGFYACDIEKIVRDVSDIARKMYGR